MVSLKTGFTVCAGNYFFAHIGDCTESGQSPINLTIPVDSGCIEAAPITCGDTTYGANWIALVSYPPMCDSLAPDTMGAWYKYTAPMAGNVTASTCHDSTDFNTIIHVYSGACDSLVCVGENDDGPFCVNGASEISWPTVASVDYYIYVSGENGATGNFGLSLNCDAPPPIFIDGEITDAICGVDSGAIDINFDGGVAPYQFSWSNGDTTEDLTNIGFGSYTVSIIGADGAEGTANFDVGIIDSIPPVLNDCPEDVSSCSPVTAFAPPTAVDNCNVASLIRTQDVTTTFTAIIHTISYTALDDAGNEAYCSFTIAQYSLPVADAGQDKTINPGDSVEIGGDPVATGGKPPYTYLWFPVGDLSDNSVANPIAFPSQTTDYITFVIDDNDCAGTDQMTVFVNNQIAENSVDKERENEMFAPDFIDIYPNPADDVFFIAPDLSLIHI